MTVRSLFLLWIAGVVAVGQTTVDERKVDDGPVSSAEVPRKAQALTYVPGKATVKENGLLLSEGLTSRLIAQARRRVLYANGTESTVPFHFRPDGAAIFLDPSSTNYKYVSNSEAYLGGGVGSLTFDKDGNVIGYERLLSGTVRNCGGGKTFWNTWLTCEEWPLGHIWEVDPFTGVSRRTEMARGYAAPYEAAAYDHRNPAQPTLYATIDRRNGPLVKFTPPASAVQTARSSQDYSQLLHTKVTDRAVAYQYLVVDPSDSTFTWTSDARKGERSAAEHFKKCEGIDIRDGILYMTCKEDKQLYILDLDAQTYVVSSTVSGAFDGQPDQVARLLEGKNVNDEILYFCEDVDTKSGVHGRDATGRYYSILQGELGATDGETTGLAFSPGNKFMYVSFQKVGKIFEIKRTDGQPFSGQRLDIKYHDDTSNPNPFG